MNRLSRLVSTGAHWAVAALVAVVIAAVVIVAVVVAVPVTPSPTYQPENVKPGSAVALIDVVFVRITEPAPETVPPTVLS